MKQNNSSIKTDQLSESSDIFSSAKNIALKGLQQYFTPEPLAKFIARVMSNSTKSPFSVIDLTAGAGNLLAPFAEFSQADKYGIEIDKRATDRTLGIEQSNLLRVFPYLKELDLQFDKVVLNPPFGLEWEYEGKTRNSAELTLELAAELMLYSSDGACIVHKNNWEKIEKLTDDLNIYPYAVYHIENLFAPASDCKSVLFFFTTSPHYVPSSGPLVSAFNYSSFPDLEPELESELLKVRPRWLSSATNTPADRSAAFIACCKAARAEAESETQLYTLQLQGKQIKARLSDFQALKIAKTHGQSWINRVKSWNGLSLRYFSLNTLELAKIKEALRLELITLEPELLEKLEAAVANSAKFTAPFYPIKETQRLGYLENLDKIKCKATDQERGYVRGESYNLSTEVVFWEGTDYKSVKRQDSEGVIKEVTREVEVQGKSLRIQIGPKFWDESAESIEYITSHFELPDPGDITNHFPEVYRKNINSLKKLETPSFKFREFQVKDLARLMCREGGVLAWEQGLGKMVGGLSWALAKGYKRVLIVAPQDLIPQWTNEARDKFGVNLIRLNNTTDARELAKKPKSQKPEFYIVHYEALSRNGRAEEVLPEKKWRKSRRNPVTGENVTRDYTSEHFCPNCRRQGAWNGVLCNPRKKITLKDSVQNGCGYTHYRVKRYNMAHYLKKTFSAVIIDEGTKIKGDNSLMSLAVRSLRPRGRLILSGTPIKNFLHDSFWLIWWAAGGSPSECFPYGYADKDQFIKDFCVLEWEKPQKGNGYKKGAVKTRPEISNLSMLWKTLAPNILRRRKSETGENLVNKRLVPVRVPFATNQQEIYSWWLQNFGNWYAERPDTELENANIATALAGLLGQLWKLRFCTSSPASERLSEHNGKQGESNATPKLLSCLQLIKDSLELREPVVVFNVMKDANQLLKRELDKAGVKSRVVDGDMKPAERAAVMQQFKTGKFQVLLAGLEAVALGHNLENARRAIIYSLPFDYAGFDQAINRIHRLTSKRDITIHILLTSGSFDEKMWNLLERKGASAGLALDGALGYEDIEELDWNKFAEELREEFQRGEAVPESIVREQIEELWSGVAFLKDESGAQVGASSSLLESLVFSLGSLNLA